MVFVRQLAARLLRWALFSGIVIVVAVALAGRLDQSMLKAYLAVCVVWGLVGILASDPDLLRERVRREQIGADPGRLAAIRLLFAVHFVIGVLDAGRLHFSPPMPPALQLAGLVLFAVALGWVSWAVSVNRFFVPVVRIQPERGHHVVTRGPYRFVRHPGYAGMVIAAPASALALGSWWALVPAVAVALLFVRRAGHEDEFLKHNLDGYADYVGAVRQRLVPGLWMVT
jgi:protein-S-isoprenylcysteine O-methyltransferase Ste14